MTIELDFVGLERPTYLNWIRIMNHSLLIAPIVALLFAPSLLAADEKPLTMKIWPGAAPGEKGDIGEEMAVQGEGDKPVLRIHNVSVPTITVYKPAADKDTGASLLFMGGRPSSVSMVWIAFTVV